MKDINEMSNDEIFNNELIGDIPDLGTEIENIQAGVGQDENLLDFGADQTDFTNGFGGFSSDPDEDFEDEEDSQI